MLVSAPSFDPTVYLPHYVSKSLHGLYHVSAADSLLPPQAIPLSAIVMPGEPASTESGGLSPAAAAAAASAKAAGAGIVIDAGFSACYVVPFYDGQLLTQGGSCDKRTSLTAHVRAAGRQRACWTAWRMRHVTGGCMHTATTSEAALCSIQVLNSWLLQLLAALCIKQFRFWFCVLPGVKRLNLGGKALTNLLKETVSYRSLDMRDEGLLMEQLKEQLCWVSQVSVL
jgi:hypothetical protein